jgi:subfamily B ATP-binding cassette protein MsbA
MKIFFRLFSYARPLEKFAIPFIFTTILSAIFRALTFTLLIPILQILFVREVPVVKTMPTFSASFSYLKDLFYYYFTMILQQENGKLYILYFVCGVFLAATILTNFFNYLSQRIMENLRTHTLLNLRKAVFAKVLSFHLGYFSNERKGDIMSKVTSDVSIVQGSITSTLIVFFKEPVNLITYVAVLFALSTQLTLFTLLILPISGVIISKIVKKLRENASDASDSLGRMIGYLDEALSAMRVVKAFNAEPAMETKFHNENIKYSRLQRKMVKRQELASPVSEILGALTIIGIIVYAGSLIVSKDHALSGEFFIAYIVAYSQVLRPAKAITNSFSSIQHGIVAGKRILELLDSSVDVKDKPDAVKIEDFQNSIEFKNVTFSYNQNKKILNDISFTLTKGKTIALVGPSGGGKSTISDLIPRFYDPQEGAIYIDGVKLKDCKIDSVRNLIGIVNQEAMLFNDTIFNNIAFGRADVTEEEVIHAAKVANAHQFILNTEKGYQTSIGDRGVKLSGGQKQRLSIARAVLKNPPILILDEATSALDTESERLVQDALTNLMKNRTSLVIAHRLSTIINADEILVIQNGQVLEKGNHVELMSNTNGLYNKLSLMQSHHKHIV